MNIDGIYNESDFKKGIVDIDRKEYLFPDEIGLFKIVGETVCRYWGKKGNIILLVDTIEGRKLKFSFWSNTKYCCEPVPKREIDVAKESVRFLPDRSKITLICERTSNAKITRIRDISLLTTSSQS